MIKTWITATSFALGGAGIALVGYLGVYPRAFTNPVAAFPAVAAYHAPEVAAPMALRTESNVIALDEVLVTASGARAPKRGSARPAPAMLGMERRGCHGD